MNKSSYLYWLNVSSKNNSVKISFYQKVIQVYYDSNGIYGAPKISAILNSSGTSCSVPKVSRAMVDLGIKSIVSKRFPKKISSLNDKEKRLIINLIKDLKISHLNQVWTTDITYIHTIYEGTFYLISFIDLFSRKVVSWGLFENQKTEAILFVLKDAIKKRNPPPGLICHSDKGSQMRSKAYRNFLVSKHFIFSYTSLNHSCDENPNQESFHASLKKKHSTK